MSTPLTDNINALTKYANETTGASDTTLSDAVNTLVNGFRRVSTAYWKTVVLEEDHTEYGSGIVSTRYWKEFLGIPDDDLYNGYVYFCIVTNNNDQSGWGKWLSGFYHALGGYITCAFYRHSYDNTVCIHYDDEYSLLATKGTVIDIFRFKKE